MKRRIITIACMLAAGLGLASCSQLQSPHYVGEKLDISEDDLGDQSTWMHGDDVYYVRRTGTNTFVAATMVWDAKQADFTVHSFPLFLSELDDHLFLNFKDGDLYSILRVVYGGETDDNEMLVLFAVDSDAMKKEIAEGKVKAHADGGNIIMDCTKEEQDEYISKNLQHMFRVDGASIVRKISEVKEKESKPSVPAGNKETDEG